MPKTLFKVDLTKPMYEQEMPGQLPILSVTS
jgi:hypothetical protein